MATDTDAARAQYSESRLDARQSSSAGPALVTAPALDPRPVHEPGPDLTGIDVEARPGRASRSDLSAGPSLRTSRASRSDLSDPSAGPSLTTSRASGLDAAGAEAASAAGVAADPSTTGSKSADGLANDTASARSLRSVDKVDPLSASLTGNLSLDEHGTLRNDGNDPDRRRI